MGEVLRHVETHLVSLVNNSPQVLLLCLISSALFIYNLLLSRNL